MNTELKAMIKMAIDLFGAGKAAVQKADFVTVILPKLYAVASDIPPVAGSFSDLGAEIKALKTLPAEADLVAYVLTNVAGVTTDAHAQGIIAAVLTAVEHLVQDVIAIESAVKGAPVA